MHRYETDEFRIVKPAETGGVHLVVDKATATTIAEMRYIRSAPTFRRWRVRPYSAPDAAPWTNCSTAMEAARYGYDNFRTP